MEQDLKKVLPVFVDASLVKEMIEVAITYRRKEEPKKSGGVRIIHAPNKALKKLQKRLLEFLYEWTLPSEFFGFVREKSIVDNALSHHAGAQGIPEWLINIDLKDAFPSVTKKILRKTLRKGLRTTSISGAQKNSRVGQYFYKPIPGDFFEDSFALGAAAAGRANLALPSKPCAAPRRSSYRH